MGSGSTEGRGRGYLGAELCVRQACPCPLTPPPAYSQRPVAAFIPAAHRQCLRPLVSQLSQMSGPRYWAGYQGLLPAEPQGRPAAADLTLGASGDIFGHEGALLGEGQRPRQCIRNDTDNPVLPCAVLRALETSGTFGTEEPLLPPLLDNCSLSFYRMSSGSPLCFPGWLLSSTQVSQQHPLSLVFLLYNFSSRRCEFHTFHTSSLLYLSSNF